MVVTRSFRARFTNLPPEVISAIVAAARPDEAAVSAGLSATCRSLRSIVLSTCTAIKLRRFGRGRQIAPLLQRFTGLQQVSLDSCVCDAVLWLELGQLQHLRHLTLPLQLAASSVQPVTALKQLTALVFTSCEYTTAEEPPVLPVTAVAALSCLELLETPFCEPLAAAGFQQLSRLQRLEVLHVPCVSPHATTRLAALLPALRSLDLRCSSTADADEEAVGQLTLAAATALTELRLHVCTRAVATVQRLQMPPQLQVLDVKIMFRNTWSTPSSSDGIVAVLNALPLQCLASLTLLEDMEPWHQGAYSPPQTELQLPEALPRLRHLHFGSCFDWDAMSVALWPLAIHAAQSTGEHEGDTWRLRVTVSLRGFMYDLTAADILQPALAEGPDAVHSAMLGHLTSADFWDWSPFRMLQEGEPERDVLRGLLAHHMQMTHLHLPRSGLPQDDMSTMYQQLGSLTALRHLCAMDLPEPKPRDYRTLQRMQQLTMLVVPLRKLPAAAQACMRALTNLQHLEAKLPLTPDLLVTLQPLHALTQLHLEDDLTDKARSSNYNGTRHLRGWASLRTLQLPLRQLQLRYDDVGDEVLAAALAHMPCLQELEIECDFKLNGPGLEVLPRCCPSLTSLRLEQIPFLFAYFLPDLQHLADLVEFEIVDTPLDAPDALAAHFPPNLTTLKLQYLPNSWPRSKILPDNWQCEVGRECGWGMFMKGLLDSLPILQAPLRHLCLQRGHKTPFKDADLECLAAAAHQLQHVERLDLGDVEVNSLQQLLALPALVELHVHIFTDDLDHSDVVFVQRQLITYERKAQLTAMLDELRALFAEHGRRLTSGRAY